ncbi:MAG: hypothetical protein MI784_14005 [Cytophagales bacterium]|nr:hypothetical protein [Cytophagales bacterium]
MIKIPKQYAYQNTKKRQVSGEKGSRRPIQCAFVEVNPREWYYNAQDPQFRERFLRAGSRQAIIVPFRRYYPHLTIDVRSTLYDKKKGIVRLHIVEMHYSPSQAGERHVFYEDVQAGVFRPEAMNPDLVSIIPLANEWLKQANLPLKIGGPKLPESFRLDKLFKKLRLDPAKTPLDVESGELVFRKKKMPKQAVSVKAGEAEKLEMPEQHGGALLGAPVSVKRKRKKKKKKTAEVKSASEAAAPSVEEAALWESWPGPDYSEEQPFEEVPSSKKSIWFDAPSEFLPETESQPGGRFRLLGSLSEEKEQTVSAGDSDSDVEWFDALEEQPPLQIPKPEHLKKKKKRKALTEEEEKAFRKIQAEFWEEQIKFVNIRDDFGVRSYNDLAPELQDRITKTMALFNKHVIESLMNRAQRSYGEDQREWRTMILRISAKVDACEKMLFAKRADESGRMYFPRQAGEKLLKRSNIYKVSPIEAYDMSRFVPESYMPNMRDKTDVLIFNLIFKVTHTFAGLMLREKCYQEKLDLTSFLLNYIGLVSPDEMVKGFAKKSLLEVKELDMSIPKVVRDPDTGSRSVTIPYDMLDLGAGTIEATWDEYEPAIERYLEEARRVMRFVLDYAEEEKKFARHLLEIRRAGRFDPGQELTNEDLREIIFSYLDKKKGDAGAVAQ